MRALIPVVTFVVLASGLALASIIEDLTGETYQHDGGSPGDTADVCGGGKFLERGVQMEGQLVVPDDSRDFWFGFVPARNETNQGQTTIYLNIEKVFGNVPRQAADLYVYQAGGPEQCGMQLGQSEQRGSTTDVVTIPAGYEGPIAIEVRADTRSPLADLAPANPDLPPIGLHGGDASLLGARLPDPTEPQPTVCHPFCTGETTYRLTQS